MLNEAPCLYPDDFAGAKDLNSNKETRRISASNASSQTVLAGTVF
jgi:hypothetical protein